MTDDDRRLLVKQSYPFKTRCEQDCEAPRKKYIQSEVSRIMTSEGTVIKNMVDGSIEVCAYYSSLSPTYETLIQRKCFHQFAE